MHLTGRAIEGPLRGTVLEPIDSGRHTRWAEWRRAHPDTDVMAPDPEFARQYAPREAARAGDDYFSDLFLKTIRHRDRRLGLADLLHGVVVEGAPPRAYPHALLERVGVVEERVGTVDLTVWFDVESRSAAAYDRRLGERLLSFEVAGGGRVRDRTTGSLWNLDGRCVSGPLLGARLRRPASHQAEWYGWFANHPDTTVAGGADAATSAPR